MAEILRQHAPEAPDAQLVARVPEARAQQKAGEVQPARLVFRRGGPARLEVEEHVEQRADGGQRPGVTARVQRLFEAAHERHGIAAGAEAGAQRGCGRVQTRRVDDQTRSARTGRLADHVAQAELEAPAMVRGGRAAPDLEGAELGQASLQRDGQRTFLELPPEAEDGANGRQGRERVGRDVEDGARPFARPIGGGEQRERDRAIGDERELTIAERHGFALFHAARHETEHRPCGLVRRGIVETEVVGASRPAADAHARSAAHEAVVGGAARHRELQRLDVQHRGTPPPLRVVPAAPRRR